MKKAYLSLVALSSFSALLASDFGDAIGTLSTPAASSKKSSSASESSAAAATPKPKKKHVVKHVEQQKQAPAQLVQVPQQPAVQIWGPRDRLPKNVTGQYVAGNFVVQGSTTEGNVILIPAEDADNPFARQFWISNRQSDLGPNALIPLGQRPLVQVSPDAPLIFIGHGILPGVYNVQAQ
jgi:hypothetical protein